jgi:hypothetical protein
MAKGNFNTQGKRQRELARRDKRAAKDRKRAERKAERAEARTAEPVVAVPVAVAGAKGP